MNVLSLAVDSRRPRAELPSAEVPPRGVAGLIFEIEDVLHDATLWRRWLWQLVARLGVRATYAEFYQDWDRLYRLDVHCGRREFGEAIHSYLLAAGLTWGQIDEIEASSRIQRQNLEREARPLPGVVKTIAALAGQGLPIVALAAAPCGAAGLNERLGRLGVASYFQGVLSSFDLEI
jgi:FMN phosphatase YigB (HAD superfamily)